MIKIVILDDEKSARNRLRNVINTSLMEMDVDYQILEFSNSLDLYKQDMNTIDILFLDIEMNGENGVDISKQMKAQNLSPIVVFVTSYDQYIRNAFGLNVHAYVMKDEIDKVIPRTLRSILADMDKKSYIVVNSEIGAETIKFNQILYFTIEDRKIHIQTLGDKLRIYGTTLKGLSTELNASFLFPNSKYIVNGMHIKSIENGTIILENDECIFISRGKVKRFHEAYKTFLISEANK